MVKFVFRGVDHHALIPALTEVDEHFIHLIYKCRVARQLLHFFVRHNEAADGFGQVDEQR